MKRIALIAAVLVALAPFGAQALNKRLGPKSYLDARNCLNLPTTEEVIKCAERYM